MWQKIDRMGISSHKLKTLTKSKTDIYNNAEGLKRPEQKKKKKLVRTLATVGTDINMFAALPLSGLHVFSFRGCSFYMSKQCTQIRLKFMGIS